MTLDIPRRSDPLEAARMNLSLFVMAQAGAMEDLSGIGFVGDPAAPDSYRSLTQAYVRCIATGEPLPVSNLYCESTIYPTVVGNLAFRFWHDMTHLRIGRAFDLDGEITVARSHLAVLEAFGYGEGTIEYELLHRDTLGQTLCSMSTGAFPLDQLCFARNAIETSLSAAIRTVSGGGGA